MTITLDLEAGQLAQLTRIAEAEAKSPATLIEALVGEYLARQRTSAIERAFGLWGDDGEDGLAYQERMRSEWDR